MVSVCTVPVRGGRSCEHFGGYKTLNRIPLCTKVHISSYSSLQREPEPQLHSLLINNLTGGCLQAGKAWCMMMGRRGQHR